MNNLTLGDAGFSYYETLGGGQGACADGDGPSGVHVAMSNTLNTPIEALEREFPLRVVEYALRRGSGGAGRHRGGDGRSLSDRGRSVRSLRDRSGDGRNLRDRGWAVGAQRERHGADADDDGHSYGNDDLARRL